MDENTLNIKSLLDIILKTTKKNANILADRYLLKDVSIIYKWKQNKVVPKNEDITQIVEFTLRESTEAQRVIIRDRIEQIIASSLLKDDIKRTIMNMDTFDDFLTEALNVSTSIYRKGIKSNESIEPFSSIINEKVPNEGYNNLSRQEDSQGQGVPGEYSGVMKFDLVLNRKGDNADNSSPGIQNIEINGLNLASKIKNHLKGEYKRKITITSIVIVGTLLNFMIFNAIYRNPNRNSPVAGTVVQSNKTLMEEKVSKANQGQVIAVKEESKTIEDTRLMTTAPAPTPTLQPVNEKQIPNTMQENKSVSDNKSRKAESEYSARNENATTKSATNNTTNITNVTTNNITNNTTNNINNNNTINHITNHITNINGTEGGGSSEEGNDSVSPDSIFNHNYLKNIKAVEIGSNHVKITWTNPSNINEYAKVKVFRKIGGHSSDTEKKLIGKIPVGADSFIDSSVKPNGQYTYQILVESNNDNLLPLLSYELEVITKPG